MSLKRRRPRHCVSHLSSHEPAAMSQSQETAKAADQPCDREIPGLTPRLCELEKEFKRFLSIVVMLPKGQAESAKFAADVLSSLEAEVEDYLKLCE